MVSFEDGSCVNCGASNGLKHIVGPAEYPALNKDGKKIKVGSHEEGVYCAYCGHKQPNKKEV